MASSESKSISNATATELYKKYSDKHISKAVLLKLFAEQKHCLPDEINGNALVSKLNRLKKKGKKLKGEYKK